jgi:hypothetical protein
MDRSSTNSDLPVTCVVAESCDGEPTSFNNDVDDGSPEFLSDCWWTELATENLACAAAKFIHYGYFPST